MAAKILSVKQKLGAASEPLLVDKLARAHGASLYTLFVDGDTVDDPFTCRETAQHARACLAENIAALSEACASAMLGNVGLTKDIAVACFYGIGQMCELLGAITEVHDNATYQCMKRHEVQNEAE